MSTPRAIQPSKCPHSPPVRSTPSRPGTADCVRPLLNMLKTQWPRCCGRGCEPCAEQLIAVAERTTELLAP